MTGKTEKTCSHPPDRVYYAGGGKWTCSGCGQSVPKPATKLLATKEQP